jgi:hypothetical protein
MNTRWLTALALAASWLFLSSASPGQGKSQGHGNPHANRNLDDDGRWEQRDGYEYRTYGDHDGRPPGWSRGKKTGWGNCGMPPGQAKKYGCREYVYQGRPHYYYRDEGGRIIVRRPEIHIHGGVDIH